jgi:membrane protease YdiL (CAAX protease family)
MGIKSTILYWAFPAALLTITHYVLVPAAVENSGQPYLVAYLIAYTTTMGLFFLAAFVAFRVEGNKPTVRALAARYRLQRMGIHDWLWSIALFLLIGASVIGLGFTARWLARWTLFAPHPIFPAEFGPGGPNARPPGTFMGSEVMGTWWVTAVFFWGLLFNIVGEELWFRGYVLPRQEVAFGSKAWLANGLMFAFTHIWQPWNLFWIMLTSLVGAYVVQRRKNTWVLIVSHALANAMTLVVLILNAFGMVV